MKVYHLYLSTKITSPTSNLVVPLQSVSTATLPSMSWMVDWDSLFKGENKRHKRCSVKFQLNADSWSAVSTDWEVYNGLLACNLASNAGSSTNYGTALGLFYPIDVPTTNTTFHTYSLNTLSHQSGVDIIPPTSNAPLQILWLKGNGAMGFISGVGVVDYQILLQFELSEPIDEPARF
jgi:hypothetical protein